MVKVKYIIAIVVLALLILVAVGFYWYSGNLNAVDSGVVKEVTIDSGASNQEIATELQQDGLIHSALVFRIYGYFSGQYQSLKAGDFVLSSNNSVDQIFSVLTQGKILTYKITIPEGLTIKETDAYLVGQYGSDGFKAGDFTLAVNQLMKQLPSNLTQTLPQVNISGEGLFLGDTYFLEKSDNLAAVLAQKMLADFQTKALPLVNQSLPTPLQNNYAVLTLASIVEQEAMTKSDRQIVAGIFLKRLANGQALQSDVTVIYGLGLTKKTVLTASDLASSSPYNTYQVKGLTPTPICNPSLESIQAVLNPTSTSYDYFLADSSGALHFAATYQEQLNNEQQYLGQ
jgi:UPF0755 protein